MINSCLNTFYKMFDICDTPQCVDLKKNSHLGWEANPGMTRYSGILVS